MTRIEEKVPGLSDHKGLRSGTHSVIRCKNAAFLLRAIVHCNAMGERERLRR